MTVDEPAVN
jgi:hypothetical protein